MSKVRVSFSFTYTRFAALCSSGLDDSVNMQPKGQRHTVCNTVMCNCEILRSSGSTMCRSWSSEALKPVNNPTGWTGGHSFEDGPLLSDPPEVHAGCPTLWDNPETMGNILEDPSVRIQAESRLRRRVAWRVVSIRAGTGLVASPARSPAAEAVAPVAEGV